jgi:hypothetical protein
VTTDNSKNEPRSANFMAWQLKDPVNIQALATDPTKIEQIAKEAIKAADEATGQKRFSRALEADRQVYRYTVLFLGSAVLLVVGAISAIALINESGSDLTIPESLVAIASAAIGALAGLLSPMAVRGN